MSDEVQKKKVRNTRAALRAKECAEQILSAERLLWLVIHPQLTEERIQKRRKKDHWRKVLLARLQTNQPPGWQAAWRDLRRMYERGIKLNGGLIARGVCMEAPIYLGGGHTDDMTQEARMGVVRALEVYNPAVSEKFSTIAALWIRAKVRRYMLENCRTIRVPIHVSELLRAVSRVEERMNVLGYSNVGAEALARSVAARTKQVQDARQIVSETGTVDLDHTDTDDGPTRHSYICSSPAEQYDDVERTRTIAIMHKVIAGLEGKERFVMQARMLGKTLLETSKLLGISKQRVHQIQALAEKRLKARLLPILSSVQPHLPTCQGIVDTATSQA